MGELKDRPKIRFKGFNGEWKAKKVNDISYSYSGGTPSVNNKSYYGGEIPFIRSAEINSKKTELTLSKDGLENSSAKMVEIGSVLYALYGATSGEVGRAKINGAINQAVLAINPFYDFDANFLSLWLRKEKKQIISTYLQGGQGNLSGSIVKNLTLLIPQFPEQSQIGTFFQHLDTLITRHQQKHTKLLTFKKAMLEKMFPKAGANVPEIRFKGFSEIWSNESLGNMGATFSGLSGKTKADFGQGDGRYVTYMNVFSNPITNPHILDSIELDNTQHQVKYGDVFFTTSSETPEEVGMSSVWLHEEENVYLNSFCFGYRPYSDCNIDSYFLAYILRSPSIRSKITFLAQGISRYNISKTRVMHIEIAFPSFSEQIKIGSFFQQLDNLIASQKIQIEKLQNLKQALLNKMFV